MKDISLGKIIGLIQGIVESNLKAGGYTDFKITVVQKLPTVGSESTIYLVPSSLTSDNNIYTEYLYINGKWEEVGKTSIKLEVDSALDENSSNPVENKAIVAALNEKATPQDIEDAINDIVFPEEVVISGEQPSGNEWKIWIDEDEEGKIYVTTIDENADDTQVPTALAVKIYMDKAIDDIANDYYNKIEIDEKLQEIVENYGVFYWDGLSSEDNPENIALWQKIVDKVYKSPVLVLCCRRLNYVSHGYDLALLFNKDFIEGRNGVVQLTGMVTDTYEQYYENGVRYVNNRGSVKITLTDDGKTITAVSGLDGAALITKKFLSTDAEGNNNLDFTPTLPQQPANKKYVDEAVENYGIFYWDGKSSTDNPENIKLWQKIIDTAENKTVLVYGTNEWEAGEVSAMIVPVIPAHTEELKKGFYSSITLKGVPTEIMSIDMGQFGSSLRWIRGTMNLTAPNGIVEEVSTLQFNPKQSSYYLPTNKETVTNYTPTYDYHPATKKYVDNLEYKDGYEGLTATIQGDGIGFSVEQDGKKITGVCLGTDAMGTYSVDMYIQDDVEPDSLVITPMSKFNEDSTSGYQFYLGEEQIFSDEAGVNQPIIVHNTTTGPVQIGVSVSKLSEEEFSFKIVRLSNETANTNGVMFLSTKNNNTYSPTNNYNPATKKYVDDAVEDLITNAVDDLVNYYLKTETYSKEEINNIINNLTLTDIKIVDELPVDDISLTTIYFVKKEETDFDIANVYDEYIFISGTWEKIGDTRVNLSDYLRKDDIDNGLSEVSTKPVENRVLKAEFDKKADKTELDTVVENYGIFYWDGKSSEDNIENISLWQKIINKAKEQVVLVYASLYSANTPQNNTIFLLNPSTVSETTTTLQIKGLINSGGITNSAAYGQVYTTTQGIVNLELENLEIKSVGQISYRNNSTNHFLPTTTTFVNSYTPTNDYHPATKKYVDDEIKNIPVFSWDGNSLGTTQNVEDWENAIKLAKTKTVLMIGKQGGAIDDPSKRALFIMTPTMFNQESGSVDLQGVLNTITDKFNGTQGNYTEITYSKVSVSWNNDFKLTSLSAMGNSTISTSKVLSTTETRENSYSPSKDWHPATKKYVDDAVDGLIDNTVNDLVNYYLKTETYSKDEVNDIINNISTLNLLKVEALPIEDIDTSTIYLVPKEVSEENNIYEEYIYTSEGWEKIGDTKVDLSNYITTESLNETLKIYLKTTDLKTEVNKIADKAITTGSDNIITSNAAKNYVDKQISEIPDEVRISDITPTDSDWKLFVDESVDGPYTELNLGKKVTEITENSTDETYPSTLAVKNYVDNGFGDIFRFQKIKEVTLTTEGRFNVPLDESFSEVYAYVEMPQNSAYRNGEIYFGVNGTTRATGYGVNQNNYMRSVIHAEVRGDSVYADEIVGQQVNVYPSILTGIHNYFAPIRNDNFINEINFYTWGGNMIAGSKMTIYGKRKQGVDTDYSEELDEINGEVV